MQCKDTESLSVLECALKLDEEWNVGFLVQTQNVQHLLLPLDILPLPLPQYVPLLTYFYCKQRQQHCNTTKSNYRSNLNKFTNVMSPTAECRNTILCRKRAWNLPNTVRSDTNIIFYKHTTHYLHSCTKLFITHLYLNTPDISVSNHCFSKSYDSLLFQHSAHCASDNMNNK